MKIAPLLLGVAVMLLPLRAQEALSRAAPVRVSIQRFTSEGAPPQLDALRSILPNLLQGGLFQFDWLSAEVSSEGVEPANPAGASRENRFVVRGQYTQFGQKVRVDVIVKSSDGSDVTGDSVTFAPTDMTAEMQKLAVRCAQALAPSRLAPTAGPGVLVSTAFANVKRQGKLSYLPGMIPRAIVAAAAGAGLGMISLSFAAGEGVQQRFLVTGSFQALADRIRVDVKVADHAGEDLSFAVESTDKFGFSLPQIVAGRVLEVLRGMAEQSASKNPVFHPKHTDAAACVLAADAARNQGKPNLAITLYRRAQRGNSPVPALRLIGIYRELNATDAALSEAQMLARTPNSPRGYFSAGLIHLLHSENQYAIEAFNKALASGAEPELKFYLYMATGDAQLALDKAAEAVASYQLALDTGAADAFAYRAFARACTKADQPVKAIDALERARGREPGNVQIREDLAALYRDQGVRLYGKDQFDEALPWLDKALILNPETPSVVSDAATHQASILAFHSDPPKNESAIRLLKTATNADPKNEWALRQLGVLNRTAQRYDDAVRNFQSAIATGTHYGNYWYLADTYLEMNQIDLAIGTLQKAVGVGGPDIEESYVRLAQAYTTRGDTDLALAALESARKIDPKDEWSWRQQAVTLRKAARFEESIQAGEQALKLSVSCNAYWVLADTYEGQKRFPEAIEMYRKTLSATGKCSGATSFLARALARQGKEAEAVEILGKLLESDPKPDADFWVLTDVYGLLGKPDRARVQLEALLQKLPDSPALLGAMSTLYHDYLFDFESAYRIRRRQIAIRPLDLDNRSDLAECATTVGHYDEALEFASAVREEKAASLQARFVMRIVTTMVLLARHDYARAQLEVGRLISDYRATRADWERTWSFSGSRHYVSRSPDFAASDRELLNLMFTAMEKNRPESDAAVNQIESLVTSDPFRDRR